MSKLEMIKVEEREGKLVTTSRNVAEVLGKQHNHLLRDIDNLIKGSSAQIWTQYISTEYIDKSGKSNRELLITEDGLQLYFFNIQGFVEEKYAYIKRYKAMEEYIRKGIEDARIARELGKAARKTMVDAIVESTENKRMHGNAVPNFTKLAYRACGIIYKKPGKDDPAFRDTLTEAQLVDVSKCEDLIKTLVEMGKNYQEITNVLKATCGVKLILTKSEQRAIEKEQKRIKEVK